MMPGLACPTGSSEVSGSGVVSLWFRLTLWSLLETAADPHVVSCHDVHHDGDDDCVQDAYCRWPHHRP